MILDQIVADTRAALPARKAATPPERLWRNVEKAPQRPSFRQALARSGVSVIAEVKRASPSRGAIKLDLEPAALARVYAAGGADALSVLTEEAHFRGSGQDLRAVRLALDADGLHLPLLRKDFIVDPYQLLEAKAWGASAVLLIVASVDDALLAALQAQAAELGLDTLVEVHDEEQLVRALALDPAVVGINNRDLRTFRVSMHATRRLRPLVPEDVLVVSESGISEPGQMRELADLGVDAALIGEALVTAPDPAARLAQLKAAGR
jgi:indole-3-glycerol phosphate synthase